MQVDPLGELRAEVLFRYADRADTARLAGRSEFGSRERIESFLVDDLRFSKTGLAAIWLDTSRREMTHFVIFLDAGESVTNGVAKENVGTESVDVHVPV